MYCNRNTDVLNTISRKAIERLGVKEDGILPNHKIMRNDRIRDRVCYSTFQSEVRWVKKIYYRSCPVIKENP